MHFFTEREIHERYKVFTVLEEVTGSFEATTKVPSRKKECRVTGDADQAFVTPHLNLREDRTDKSVAFVVWCREKERFSFRHYLSLRSLLHIVQPDEVRFVYSHGLPIADESGYHQWLRKIGEEYPFLRFIHNENSCRKGILNEQWIFESMVYKRGGIFLHPNVILKPSFFNVINGTYEALKVEDANNRTLVFSMKRSFALKNYKKVHTGISYFVNKSAVEKIKILSECNTAFAFPSLSSTKTTENENAQCLLTDAWNETVYPYNIKSCDSQICTFLQRLYYGYAHLDCVSSTTHIPSTALTIPNIVHYIHFGRFQFKFMFYLSILSFIYIQKVERVYIHCDQEPHGPLWSNLVEREKDKLQLVYRSNPGTVFNQSISVVEHMADIAKADIAYKYGGILSDPDVVMVQKLKSDWFIQDTVVGYDIGSRHPFPDILNLGIFLCKPRSEFVRLWKESMKTFNDSDWLWNSGKMTYKIVENDPRLAVIEPRLQVICFKFKCYPTWLPKHVYQDLDTSQDTLTNSLRDWATQAHSFHFTFPEPFLSEAYLSKQGGIAGEVGRHVYKSAGIEIEGY